LRSGPRLLLAASAPHRADVAAPAELAQGLADDFAAGWTAHDLFLAWLLALPGEVDPSFVATAVLARIEALRPPGPCAGELARLAALLEEATRWPRPVLDTCRPRGRRRACACA
jgi:hypothetical protein